MRRILHTAAALLLTAAVSAEAAAFSSVDKLGRQVELPVPTQRAVLLQMYEFLPLLRAWDKVVGVGNWAHKSDFIQAVSPAEISAVPAVGSGMDANIEAVLRLRPDLVLTWSSKPDGIRFMEEKGLRIFSVYPESIPELYSVMNVLGKVFQQEDRMTAAQAEMEALFSMIRERAAKKPAGQKKKMLYLNGQRNNVSCGQGINNDLLEMIGGSNPAAGFQQNSALIPLEQIIVWNPEVIFIWGSAGYTAEDILSSPQWRNVAAVRSRQVYKLPRWSTWSPRLPLVALTMAKLAYPEDYQDVDLSQAEQDYHRRLFASASPQAEQPH